MKWDFLILGSSGIQGRIVTKDLLDSGFKVHCADLYREGSEENLSNHPGTKFTYLDLRNYDKCKNFFKKIKTDIVINCSEGDYNYDVYQLCLENNKHVIDLGSEIPMTKSQLKMDSLFKKAGLIAITGSGSTPGINNIMMKYASRFFKEIDTIEIGFNWDSNIKKFVIPFSIESIIEELIDPAPILEDGVWVEKIPLETEEVREIREIGSQKCYLVRHPETYTFSLDYKKYNVKNIRFYAGFPNHSLEVLLKFIELGLSDKKLIKFENKEIRPIDALSRILSRLKKPSNYSEKENLWVEVTGIDDDGIVKIIKMECIVNTLPGWNDAGCNIDTGLPTSIIAQMIFDKKITKRGSFTPENVVPVEEFLNEIIKRGLFIYQNGNLIESF